MQPAEGYRQAQIPSSNSRSLVTLTNRSHIGMTFMSLFDVSRLVSSNDVRSPDTLYIYVCVYIYIYSHVLILEKLCLKIRRKVWSF